MRFLLLYFAIRVPPSLSGDLSETHVDCSAVIQLDQNDKFKLILYVKGVGWSTAMQINLSKTATCNPRRVLYFVNSPRKKQAIWEWRVFQKRVHADPSKFSAHPSLNPILSNSGIGERHF